MKLRTTTLASLSKTTKGVIIAVIAVLLVMTSIVVIRSNFAAADPYDDKIVALQRDMARYQKEADRLNGEAVTLQNTVAKLTNEREALQAQIDLNQNQYNKLVKQITQTEAEIKENQDALGTTLADLYVDSGTTPIELLAGSDNITDFINKQEYRTSIRDQLGATIEKVKTLKAKLDEQKADVAKVLRQQKDARKELVAKENAQQRLLDQTNNNEATYQRMIKNNKAQIAEARATQASIRARLNGSGGYVLIDTGSASGYPWNSSNCPMQYFYSTGGADGNGGDGLVDSNGNGGYGCRQCASYVAWRVGRETGYLPTNWGNAVDFTANAKRSPWNGVEGGPRAGSVAVMNPGKAGQSFGHVAWVESVSGDKVTVSQYNYDYGQGYGMYSKMTLSASAFDHYIKIK